MPAKSYALKVIVDCRFKTICFKYLRSSFIVLKLGINRAEFYFPNTYIRSFLYKQLHFGG